MRGTSTGLVGLGIVVVLIGILNHFVLRLNPFNHTSTAIAVVGVVVLAIGVFMMVTGGRASAAK